MAHESAARFLIALGGASTSRVLNLGQIAQANKHNPEHAKYPLFLSPLLNTSFIVKHQLRSNEAYQFDSTRTVATKIISPIDPSDLSAGGRSILIDQRGFEPALQSLGNYEGKMLERDLKVLRLLNALPSLDPFLLRQHLCNYKIEVAPCYFPISQKDQDGMHEFVTCELTRLTSLLGSDASSSSTRRMVAAMLSSDVAEELGPLRETLNLSGDDFRQGVFSWRGFLYYKWSIGKFWPDVMDVLREVSQVNPVGVVTSQHRDYLVRARRSIVAMVSEYSKHVNTALSVYDTSFSALVAQQKPKTFRDFLVNAPYMFLELGEKIGAISHIVGFWRHRFPAGQTITVGADDLATIFQDFSGGFSERIKGPPSLIKPPTLIDMTGQLT